MSEASPASAPKWQERVEANPLTVLGVALSLIGLAWSLRFVQDDAFVSFVYARN